MKKYSRLLLPLLVILAWFAPAWVSQELLIQIFCMALFASAFNLLFGYGGMLSFGHAAFYGVGAYITAYLMKILEFGLPLLAILAGGVGAAILAFVIGSLAVRRHGVYLAMITLALAEVVSFTVHQLPLGGEDGLQGVPRGMLLGVIDLSNANAMYAFVVCIFAVCMWALYRIIRSPFGHMLQAIKDNEQRMISLGCDVIRCKVTAFVLSGFFAGIAGSTKTLAFHFAALGDVHWHKSGEVVLMTLLGGIGSFAGPAVGAVIVVLLSDTLAFLNEWVNFILGAIFLACVLLFREGVVGTISRASSPPAHATEAARSGLQAAWGSAQMPATPGSSADTGGKEK
ncbi:MAG: branched-chain amino acid ABC transporter permease [Pusillimonas sp.]